MSRRKKTKKDEDNDYKSTRTTIVRSSVKKLANYANKMSRVFTTFNTQRKKLKGANSDLSEYEDEDEASHFQMAKINFGKSDFQFAQLNKEFEPHIASIFNKTYGRNVSI